MNVYVSFDGDGIGQMIGRASLDDDVAQIRKLSHAIERAGAIFASWALACGGSVIEIGGDEGRIIVPADKLTELPALRQQYESACGHTATVGVGMKLSEADKALLVGKTRGKDRICMWDPDMQAEIDTLKPKSEADKISEEYLKSEEELNKFHPPFRFPGLGMGDDRRETPIVKPGSLEHVNKIRTMYSHAVGPDTIEHPQIQHQMKDDVKRTFGMMTMDPDSKASYSVASAPKDIRGDAQWPATRALHPNSDQATVQHENLHSMFSRVAGQYGDQVREALAYHLGETVPAGNPGMAMWQLAYAKYRNGLPRVGGQEEVLTGMLNYLNNPAEREAFHKGMGHTPKEAREFHKNIYDAYQHVWQTAQGIKPEHLEPIYRKWDEFRRKQQIANLPGSDHLARRMQARDATSPGPEAQPSLVGQIMSEMAYKKSEDLEKTQFGAADGENTMPAPHGGVGEASQSKSDAGVAQKLASRMKRHAKNQQVAEETQQAQQNGEPPPTNEAFDQQTGQVIMQALQRIKQQAPVLEKIKDSNPEAYQSILGLVQAVVLMSQEITKVDLQKSEPGKKPVHVCRCKAYEFPHRHKGGKCKGALDLTKEHVVPTAGNLEKALFSQKPKDVCPYDGKPTAYPGVLNTNPRLQGEFVVEPACAEHGLHHAWQMIHARTAPAYMAYSNQFRGDTHMDARVREIADSHKQDVENHLKQHGMDPGAYPELAPHEWGKFKDLEDDLHFRKPLPPMPDPTTLQAAPVEPQAPVYENGVSRYDAIDKAGIDPHKTLHHNVTYPVGTVLQDKGKVKVAHSDGSTSWVEVRAGQIMSEDGHAISSRNPGGK